MAHLVLTELDDAAEEHLKARARRHGRSVEAEAWAILEEAAREESLQSGSSEEGATPRHAGIRVKLVDPWETRV